MSIFGDLLGSVLPMVGAAQASSQKQKLSKKLLKQLKKKQTPLEIPQAFQQLLAQLNAQMDGIGNAKRTAIENDFGKSIATALSRLKQRGVASSNLTANLMAGNTKKKNEQLAALDESLLAQRMGLQSGIGLAGLQTSAAERGQQLGIQGGIYNQLAAPVLVPQGDPMGGLLKGLAGVATTFA